MRCTGQSILAYELPEGEKKENLLNEIAAENSHTLKETWTSRSRNLEGLNQTQPPTPKNSLRCMIIKLVNVDAGGHL